MWFRADLRVRDNLALHAACVRASGGVVAVFAVCPEQWRDLHDWSDAKVDFVLRNLAELKAALGKLNIPLKIVTTPRFDGVPAALTRLAHECRCSAIFYNREYEWNERRRDDAVDAAMASAGVPVHALTDQVVFAPGEVMTKAASWYTVFSPFKRAWRERYAAGEGPTSVGMPKKQPAIEIEADAVPEAVEGFDRGAAAVRPDLWGAGEAHAGERLAKFVDARIDAYKERRDLPAINGTSTLSPYLAAGVLSPRQCVEAALAVNGGRIDAGGAGVMGWIDELIWREFYKHVLVGFPRVSRGRAFKVETERVAWREDTAGLEAWKAGRTGYPIVDAAMRQLAQTGWMHNRLRMITAMFLTKDLLIDWRHGERHFMRTLVDGDLSANNGGWQWSASTGTDAQPYFRIFNPTTQGEKFDPEGVFIRKFVPELSQLTGKAVHAPSATGLFGRGGLDYPAPIVDHKVARDRALAAFKAIGKG